MILDAVGKIGEVCDEANVPALGKGERVIGFRQLEYEAYEGSLIRRPVLPPRAGWVYQTNLRIVMLDDGREDLPDGTPGKRYHDVPFAEVVDVHWKKREVRIPVEADGRRLTLVFRPFGAAARLFDWLRQEKEKRRARERGKAASPYAKVRGQPPKG